MHTTVIHEMNLPHDVADAHWYEDLNMVVIRRGLTPEEREQAVEEMQTRVRRALLHAV